MKIKRFQEIAEALLKKHYGLELNDTILHTDEVVADCIKQGYRPYQVVDEHADFYAEYHGIDRISKDGRSWPVSLTPADEDAVIQHLPIPSIVFAAKMNDHTKAMSMYEAFAKGSSSMCSQNHEETIAMYKPNQRAQKWFLLMLEKGRGYLTSDEQASTSDKQSKNSSAVKKDYVVLIGGGVGIRWLSHDSIEDDGERSTYPPTTTDPEMACRSTSHSEIQKMLKAAVRRYPGSQFRIDVIDPFDILDESPRERQVG